jgi:hypothetical protein
MSVKYHNQRFSYIGTQTIDKTHGNLTEASGLLIEA